MTLALDRTSNRGKRNKITTQFSSRAVKLDSFRYLEGPSAADALSNTIMSSQTSESLLKRLAGPSTGKAGLAKDQTEINRIIAGASKGSRFYEVGPGRHGSIDTRYLNSQSYRMRNARIRT